MPGLSTSDFPTMRLVTLRTLVKQTPAPLIFDAETDLATIITRLDATAGDIAILVTAEGVLAGTLCRRDVRCADLALPAAARMRRDAPVLLAECDIAEAMATLAARGADCVVVATPAGELLGVLTARFIQRNVREATPSSVPVPI